MNEATEQLIFSKKGIVNNLSPSASPRLRVKQLVVQEVSRG